jgi:hypothetical protein
VHGALAERPISNPRGRSEAVDTGLTAKAMMTKASAVGAEAIEVLIKEMHVAGQIVEHILNANLEGFGYPGWHQRSG